jgi:hypothetical protein
MITQFGDLFLGTIRRFVSGHNFQYYRFCLCFEVRKERSRERRKVEGEAEKDIFYGGKGQSEKERVGGGEIVRDYIHFGGGGGDRNISDFEGSPAMPTR